MKKNREKKESLWLFQFFFVLLLIVVIILGICIFKSQKNKKQSIYSDFSIPILEADSEIEFAIDTYALAQEKAKEYVFRIANYRKNRMLEEDVTYQVFIENPTSAVVALKKNNEGENLMQDTTSVTLDETLSKDKKEEVYYHVFVDSKEEVKKDDFIYVRIVSKTKK